MTKIETIMTHEYPDFDCLYSVYLLRKFGETKYPGIREAALQFVPAESIPEDQNGQQLLEQGTLALDLHRGYYDHHEVLDNDRSTARIVAQDLNIEEDPCLQKILDFVDQNDLHGVSIQSRRAVDQLICIPNIIKGLNLKYKDDYAKVYHVCEEMFEAAYMNERDWFLAIEDIQKGSSHKIGNIKILSFSSASKASAKAGRYCQGDLCVIQGEALTYNFTTRRSKRWPEPDLTRLAKVIRLAEGLRAGHPIDEKNLNCVGTFEDWFLHQSLVFFSRGSFKKTDVPPSLLSLHELSQLAIFCFDPQPKFLGDFSEHFDRFKQVLHTPMTSQLRQ